jgi:hypothetical protein
MNYIPPRRSDGTIQHTRVKLAWPKDRLFRILAIDGGGIRGMFPAAYLAEIEKRRAARPAMIHRGVRVNLLLQTDMNR